MENEGLTVQGSLNLLGHDNRANLDLRNGSIYRTIKTEFISETTEVFLRCDANENVKRLLVETKVHFQDPNNLVLSHELLNTSYPCEWTPTMLIDAALHTLEISDALKSDGLAIKDFLPSNLLYTGKQWKFIDFCSIIKEESLLTESWIPKNKTVESSKRSIFKIMFIPFILIPILVGTNGSTKKMSSLLKFNYCNSGKWAPGWRNLLFLRPSKSYFSNLNFLRRALAIIRKTDITEINSAIRRLLIELRNVTTKSAYSEYENSSLQDKSKWNEKQKSIDCILEFKQPRTLIDIGANTGWYSMLGLQRGSTVYAIDSDCASLDIAYRKTLGNGLIPFHLDFNDIWLQANSASVAFNKRYLVDMVLALGLVHHLVLGHGLTIETVIQRLSTLTRESLVIEFVELSDEKILHEPAFFKHLKPMSKNYRKEEFIEKGLKYFGSVETFLSTPKSRTILIFTR